MVVKIHDFTFNINPTTSIQFQIKIGDAGICLSVCFMKGYYFIISQYLYDMSLISILE